ncbi:ABC transporter ATP-binding protein [Limosilactobacillus sp. STM2_1]|uniref:ABC transporter ATP-binding protein n=1 Tax=Limosilactobacillus rudii TaxID=2759755 RepID=A0A7W3UKK4_9LACO|nr:ABC transporter ATP-binding protein [Limosilactobacillus rudii]MBB1079205.1 ABC transporter ATP-binding protein [Limosilactobacillus rudii]MBB1097294.1 ABC transporter ATP-binding protein [Limosilactobacillus rudii]MCD7134403.1 ABC transporter ATP-binding protein [Limosilactobacillus rudii]
MLITTQNLTKKYGNKVAVNNLNLSIPRGALVAYLGTNGAGKSTTIKMLTGLLRPSTGTIIYANNLKMGVVFQESVLDDGLTVQENLQSRAAMYQSVEQSWIKKLKEMMGLSNFYQQKYGTLSGGQKRRVDIARALLNHPDILFLDEPTTGLDIQTRNVIWKLLRKLKQEQQLTIFLTTHYLEEASNAEMIYVLEHGKVLAQGSADKLIKNYAENQLILYSMDNVKSGRKIKANTYLLTGIDYQQAITILNQRKKQLASFEYRHGDLNDAFINITGKELQ